MPRRRAAASMERDMAACFPNGIRALIVTDDARFLASASMLLSLLHFQVASCGSPSSALRLLSTGDKHRDVDVVLIDAERVATCGFDFRGIVEPDLHIPVIYFLSLRHVAVGQEADELLRTLLDSTYIIGKPLDAEDICALWRVIAWRRCVLDREPAVRDRVLPAAVEAILAGATVDGDAQEAEERIHFRVVRGVRGRKRKNAVAAATSEATVEGGQPAQGQDQMNMTEGQGTDDVANDPQQKKTRSKRARKNGGGSTSTPQNPGATDGQQPAGQQQQSVRQIPDTPPHNPRTVVDAAGPSSSNNAAAFAAGPSTATAAAPPSPAWPPVAPSPVYPTQAPPPSHFVYPTPAPQLLPPWHLPPPAPRPVPVYYPTQEAAPAPPPSRYPAPAPPPPPHPFYSTPALIPRYPAPAPRPHVYQTLAPQPAPYHVYPTQALYQMYQTPAPGPVHSTFHHHHQQPAAGNVFGNIAPAAAVPAMAANVTYAPQFSSGNHQQPQDVRAPPLMFGPFPYQGPPPPPPPAVHQQGMFAAPARASRGMRRRRNTGPVMLSFQQPHAGGDQFAGMAGGGAAFGAAASSSASPSAAATQDAGTYGNAASTLIQALNLGGAEEQRGDGDDEHVAATVDFLSSAGPPVLPQGVDVAANETAAPNGNQFAPGALDIRGSLVGFQQQGPAAAVDDGNADVSAMFPSGEQYEENTMFSLEDLMGLDGRPHDAGLDGQQGGAAATDGAAVPAADDGAGTSLIGGEDDIWGNWDFGPITDDLDIWDEFLVGQDINNAFE